MWLNRRQAIILTKAGLVFLRISYVILQRIVSSFKFIFLCATVLFLIQIALKIIPSGPINIYAPFGLNELIKDSVIVLQLYLWLI